MDIAPCNHMTDAFVASLSEIRDHVVERPDGYAPAISVCEKDCPLARRQSCAADGVRYRDRHMVRAGLRLWIHEERAQLLGIAQGSELREDTQ